MTNQVTSIEQSKRLLELGAPAEMAGMVWDITSPAPHPVLKIWDTDTKTKHRQAVHAGHIPAFTTDDLLGALPGGCRMPDGTWINMEIGMYGSIWRLSYFRIASGSDEILCGGAGREYFFKQESTQVMDLLYGAAEWLLSNGYKLRL